MNDVENIGRNGAGAGKNPMDMSPEELHANIWKILKFRDNVMKRIETTIEKIPGLSALIDRITEA